MSLGEASKGVQEISGELKNTEQRGSSDNMSPQASGGSGAQGVSCHKAKELVLYPHSLLHTMNDADDVLWNCALETYMGLLTSVTPNTCN